MGQYFTHDNYRIYHGANTNAWLRQPLVVDYENDDSLNLIKLGGSAHYNGWRTENIFGIFFWILKSFQIERKIDTTYDKDK